MLDIIFVLNLLLAVFILKTVFLLLLSMLHLRLDKSPAEDDNYNPLVSVLVPAYNEQLTLRNSIQSILNQTYQNLEIIIIDDGSTDHTNSIAKDIENKFERVSVVTKGNGGKSSALNFGVISSSGEIVVCVDADTVLHPEAIANMTKCFSDTSIAAVSGNVKVANRKNFWGITQSLEYVNSLALQRRAFAYLKTTHVVPGAIGGFRRDKLLEAGLFSSDTLVEDMDLTMKLASRGEKIEFCTKAIAYTEAPQTFSGLYKQRYRWSYGTWQVLYKYRNSIFQNGLNIFSGILYPYLFTFAVIDVITTFLFVGLFIFAVMNGLVHFYLFYLSMFIVLKFLLSLYSTVNLNDSKDSTLFTIQEYVFYTHIVSLISLKSLVDLTLGKPTLWNGVPRLGKNQLSASV